MNKKQLIKKSLFFMLISILILIVIAIMLRYEVEGEKDLPYSLSKILLISTVEGAVNPDEENIWNIGVEQCNDVYIYIDSEHETKETIKQITLENFNISKMPQKGEVIIYRPTGELDNLYDNSEQNYLNDKLVYIGSTIDDMKSLEIGNTGGVIGFRLSLNDLGNFISNEDMEIIYDGRLLSNINVTVEEINLNLDFDIIIETNQGIKYKGNIGMNMPAEDLIEKGTSNIEITDFSNVVFKRV